MSTAAAEPISIIPYRLLSMQDLAAILHISKSTVESWRYAGKLPEPVQIGRHVRWHPDQIRTLVGEPGAATETDRRRKRTTAAPPSRAAR